MMRISMNNYSTQLTDNEFIKQFETLTLDPSEFNHIGHLRLAWLYLQSENNCKNANVENVIDKISKNIKSYATFLGATDKFHITITHAIVQIVNQRMQPQEMTWQDFISNNEDLVLDAKAVLTQYFSSELLFSEQARTSLVAPDIQSWE